MITVGEIGKTLNLNTGTDLSAATDFEVVFTKPDGTTITKGTADGVALGVAPYTAECSIYAANEYISYAVEAGVIDTDGDWYVRSVVYFGTVKYVGKNALMKVFA